MAPIKTNNNKKRINNNQDIKMSFPSRQIGAKSSSSRVATVAGGVIARKNKFSGALKKVVLKKKCAIKQFVFKLESFAPELRMMIFDLVFAGTWNGKIPALLKALRRNEVMYKEALEAFIRSNTFALSKANESALLGTSATAMGSIKYLKLGNDEFHQHVFFSQPDGAHNERAIVSKSWSSRDHGFNAALTRQYCRTPMGKIFSEAKSVVEIHFDIWRFWGEKIGPLRDAVKMCLTHFPKLQRIIFTQVMDGVCQCNPDTGIHAKRTHRLDRFLGCKARLWKVGARCYFDDWFWEAEKGKTLTWTDPSQGVNWENL